MEICEQITGSGNRIFIFEVTQQNNKKLKKMSS